jgi:hypothetical protein
MITINYIIIENINLQYNKTKNVKKVTRPTHKPPRQSTHSLLFTNFDINFGTKYSIPF